MEYSFLDIEQLQLPEAKTILKNRGIVRLNPPQTEAIRKGLLEGKRLVIASPTASGKTLIAELGAISHLKREGGKVVYVTPLRALTTEKYSTFKEWEPLGFKVGMTSGEYDSEDNYLKKYDIIVTTYEKLDSLWRHRPGWLEEANYFILDELHYLNDPSRGPVVESVAVRAKRRGVLALSATISNYQEISRWLHAEYVSTPWRPVKLVEGVMYPSGKGYLVTFKDGTTKRVKGDDPIEAYTLDSISRGGQVLIFRNSRRYVEGTAKSLSTKFKESQELLELSKEIEEVEDAGATERESLSLLVKRGVAYHHAGLSRGLREIIERGFKERKIKVIVATPTLAAGVNLPARTVIVGDVFRYNRKVTGFREEIPVMEYKQMSGRAGRPGFDSEGESIIVLRDKRNFERIFEKYLTSDVEPIESKLGAENAFYSFLLGTLSADGEMTRNALRTYVEETLLSDEMIDSHFDKGVEWLKDHEFITEDETVHLTQFGKKVADIYVNPFTAVTVKDSLKGKPTSCDLAYLHMLAYTPDAPIVGTSNMDESLLYDVDCKMFIDEPFDELEMSLYLSAMKIAFIIHDWIEEVDEDTILSRYGIGSGDLRNMVESMDWLTYSGYMIAQVMKEEAHEESLRKLNMRVKDGVKEELVELVQIPGIGRKRARQLWNEGIRSLADVVMEPEKIKRVLGDKIGERTVHEAARILGKGNHGEERGDDYLP